jgi:CRISPR-associated protein Cas8a1/Csx13
MDSLEIDLFGRGMGPLHRAGLGGLTCTLDRLQWPDSEWAIDDEGTRLTLKWPGGDEGARAFFERLYAQAFALKKGMIDLPGACGDGGIDPAIQAELQRGMSLTILQFGPNRKAASKAPKVVSYEIDQQPMTVQYQDLVDYTHRGSWKDLVTPKGTFREMVTIPGTIAPGFVQRHVAHPASVVEQPPGHAIALHFALVGTFSLPIGRSGRGVLIVPDVRNLHEFIRRRPMFNPREPRECQIASPADAALQAQVRLRATEAGLSAGVDRCLAVLFSSTMWNPNQKARAAVLEVDPWDSELDLYADVLSIQALKARLAEAKPEKKGDPPRKFWAGGIVRALIAENVAHHRKWFTDFRSLVVGPDGKTDDQRVWQLNFEKEGLQKMIERPWEDHGEETLVRAIHQAMSQCFGKIWEEAGNDTTTFQNRYDRQMERWRLAFAHAKTADDVRGGLSDIWGRAGQVPVLMESWRELLPILCRDDRWQLNRDLALLALSSYRSTRKKENGGGAESSPARDRA